MFEGCLRNLKLLKIQKAEELTWKKVHSLWQYDIVKAHVPMRRKALMLSNWNASSELKMKLKIPSE